MEDILKKLVQGSLPYMLDYYLDNKHIVVDFFKQQSLKEDNRLDEDTVDILEEWLETL